MPYCTNCGSEIKENVNFCPSCGAKLNIGEKTEVPATSSPSPSVTPPETTPKKREGKYTKEGRKIIDSGPHPQQNHVNTPVKKKKKRGCLGCLGKGLLIFLGVLIIGILIIILMPDTSEVDRFVSELPALQKGQEISKDVGVKAVEVGSLEVNNIQLLIPERTFDRKRVKLDVNEIADAPVFNTERANRIGPVYDISIDQRSKRLNKPVTVKLRLFKPEDIKIEHPDDFWISYYNGREWEYFRPSNTDLKGDFIEFDTYHFSWFSTAKPTKEERIIDFAKKEAVNQWAKRTNSKPVEKAIQQILLGTLGIKNKSMLQDIVESMMNEDDFQKLAVSYNDNNKIQFNQDLAILAGKQIVEIVKDYDVAGKTVLKGVTDHASKINTGINITRALTEGDYEKAAKELSMEIINSYPITKLFREGARVIGNEIKRWKDQGVKDAFEVYKNGVNEYGYIDIKKGDFDAVWDQMKGLQTQILRDGIKDYGISHNIDVSKLGHTALNRIRRQIKEDLRKEFIKRKKEEAEIEKLKEENIRLIREFEGAHLLSKGSFGYTDQTSFDQMLRRLFLIKNMILKDTRSKVGFSGVNKNGIISAKMVARLIQIWYSKNGKEKYREELVKLGYKEKEISDNNKLLKDISGTWEGYFQITKNTYVESMTKSAAYVFEAVGLGDDAKESLKAAESVFEEPEGLRKKRYMKMVLKPSGRNNHYKVNATIEGDEGRQTYSGTAKFKNGEFQYELKDQSGSINFNGKSTSFGSIKGTFYIGSKLFKAAEGKWEIKKNN
jgi:hypothetical protein